MRMVGTDGWQHDAKLQTPRRISRKELGALGEEAAIKHLVKLGYRILDRNWRCRLGELDAVVTDGDMLVFVEVRTRSTARFGTGAESVDTRKQMKLRQLALAYMRERAWSQEKSLRFDVVSVRRTSDGRYELDHIKHAI